MSVEVNSNNSKNTSSERPGSSPQSVPYVSQVATGNDVSLENPQNKKENLTKFQETINKNSNSQTL